MRPAPGCRWRSGRCHRRERISHRSGKAGRKSVDAQVLDAARAAGPALRADRPLDHLHVAVAPFLDALVEVDQPLRDERRVRVAAVDRDQHLLDRVVGRRRRRAGPGVRARRGSRGTTSQTDGAAWASSIARRAARALAAARRRPRPRSRDPSIASICAEPRRLEPRRRVEPVAERQELERGHRLEDVDLRDERLEDLEDAVEQVERAVGVAGLERQLDAAQLVAERLEPQLVDLVDDDEQQLVVLGAVRPGRALDLERRAAPGP